ncbi:MAG: hypothetical protein GX589_00725 [Deltaproteobacteria bacterium]|nr:hypothetical protein [Deltaproteobacteria bacterium]
MNSGKPEPLSHLFNQADTVPLALLSCLIRGLTHRLRTPLAVISNDLSYFKTVLPAEECERSQLRCREVAAALKDISACSVRTLKLEDLSIERLLVESACAQQIAVTWECERDLRVRADSGLLIAALRWFFEGWGALGRAGLASPKNTGCRVTRCLEFQALSVSLQAESHLEPGEREYHTLAAFYDECPDLDQYTSALVDAIVWAHSGQVNVRVGPLLELSILLPVSK